MGAVNLADAKAHLSELVSKGRERRGDRHHASWTAGRQARADCFAEEGVSFASGFSRYLAKGSQVQCRSDSTASGRGLLMVYLDTSFVAPLVIAENSSDAVEAFVLKVKPGELTTSMWTQVELSSLVSRKIRMGDLSDSQAEVVRREFDRVLAESFEMLAPTAADFAAAARYLESPKTGLRAGDALHLAIAANHRAKRILSLDQGFVEAGKLLKLPVTLGVKV